MSNENTCCFCGSGAFVLSSDGADMCWWFQSTPESSTAMPMPLPSSPGFSSEPPGNSAAPLARCSRLWLRITGRFGEMLATSPCAASVVSFESGISAATAFSAG
jgi:hypothetical protein